MIYVIGYPADCGGACTELWHVLRLWREHHIPVTLIPAIPHAARWQKQTEAIGCRTVANTFTPRPGSVVVSLGSQKFLLLANELRTCKLVWAPCMCWQFPEEVAYYKSGGRPFDAYVFQSEFQRAQWPDVPEDRQHLIPGAFCIDEFPFRPRPHARPEGFTVGRISRNNPDKFHPDLWQIYGQIPNVRARVLGWCENVRQKVGTHPPWARVLEPTLETPQEFYSQIHALLPISGADENWPRVGLEAMASGVPIVAENRSGWREMIEHGRTGFLCDTPDQIVAHATRLAGNETLRLSVARAAREAVEQLAAPEPIWRGWEQIFREVGVC